MSYSPVTSDSSVNYSSTSSTSSVSNSQQTPSPTLPSPHTDAISPANRRQELKKLARERIQAKKNGRTGSLKTELASLQLKKIGIQQDIVKNEQKHIKERQALEKLSDCLIVMQTSLKSFDSFLKHTIEEFKSLEKARKDLHTYISQLKKSATFTTPQPIQPLAASSEKTDEVPANISSQPETAQTETIEDATAPQNVMMTSPLQHLSPEEKMSTTLKLYKRVNKCHEHPRVRRWATVNTDEIRQFTDILPNGSLVYRYKNCSDKEILQQRARHYLPGTERLVLNEDFRNSHAFATNRGYGMLAQLCFQNSKMDGILYIGLDAENVIFHKYFEPIDFSTDVKSWIVDKETALHAEPEFDNSGWQSDFDFEAEVTDKNVFKFTYSKDHHIYIYPMIKE